MIKRVENMQDVYKELQNPNPVTKFLFTQSAIDEAIEEEGTRNFKTDEKGNTTICGVKFEIKEKYKNV